MQVRFGALFDDGFITKRKESSTSNNNKVWPLHSKCALTKIESKKLTVIKNSHTLLSLAYGGYNSRKLVRSRSALCYSLHILLQCNLHRAMFVSTVSWHLAWHHHRACVVLDIVALPCAPSVTVSPIRRVILIVCIPFPRF